MTQRPDQPNLGPALAGLVEDLDPRRGGPVAVGGLHGAAPALVIAALQQAGRGPLLVVTPRAQAAEDLIDDLGFLGIPEGAGVHAYPAWDVHPYDGLSPHIDIHFRRMSALAALRSGRPDVVVAAPVEALLKKVAPAAALTAAARTLSVEGQLDPHELADHLSRIGYLATDMVVESASFSVRGGIVDLFPPGHRYPVRLELWGDTVDSLREFDPQTQRSVRALKRLEVLPVREELLTSPSVDLGQQGLRALSEARGVAPKHRRRLSEDLSEGLFFPNIEYFLPLLHPPLVSVLDHLPPGASVVLLHPAGLAESAAGAWDRIAHRHAELATSEPLLPGPEALFFPERQLLEGLRARHAISLGPTADPAQQRRVMLRSEPTAGLRQSMLAHRGDGMLTPFVERVRAWAEDGIRTFVACHSELQARRLADLLGPYGVGVPRPAPAAASLFLNPSPVNRRHGAPVPVVGTLSEGFALPAAGVAILSEEDLFGPRVRPASSPRQFLKNAIDSFSQLKVGDFVVHAIHGIGVFRGVARVGAGGGHNDFVQIEYDGGDKLYLPVHRLHTLQRYVGQKGSEPRLDKMGGVSWKKTTRKVKESVLKVARQLLDLYAARTLAGGQPFEVDRLALESFEASFPYDETPDQLEAIHAVITDMESPRPMDRLICGDVGYGKTEVALRAAWVAVMAGRQVGVLVPTTVLAFQHFRTFQARFAELPVNVAQLSRFVSASEQEEVTADLARGGVDIVIGTHRLLSHDVRFKDLGLLIVDEEHRFGVRHKEHIKRMRKDVDILTMTATPIPRTLHMATAGLRDLSVIATPPRDRSAIRTFVTPFSASRIRQAIEEELERGGQVFFVHNRVNSIDAMTRYLSTLVPRGSFDVVHGQMSEGRIEGAMRRFIEGETTVLVTTAIIESGLDIPRANTIIINRADRLGLAQLYQLRGRVGRSNRRAFAFLLTPAGGPATEKASRRLRALESHSELGAGFKIASEDLEMRGAGNLLGKNQSGSIAAVGFETYIELLHKAVQELSGQDVDDDFDPDVDIRVEAFIPEDYIADFQLRLQLYRRLATAVSELELRQHHEELADRYGAPPEPVKLLLEIMGIRVLARRLRIAQILATPGRIVLRFDESTPIDRGRLATMAMGQRDRYRLSPDGRLTVKLRDEEAEDLPNAAKNLLRRLS